MIIGGHPGLVLNQAIDHCQRGLLGCWQYRTRFLTLAQPRSGPRLDIDPGPVWAPVVARKAVVAAARRHDPQATRQALSAWSRTLWPTTPQSAYEQLCRSAGPNLRQELEALDQCLYGSVGATREGQGRAEAITVW